MHTLLDNGVAVDLDGDALLLRFAHDPEKALTLQDLEPAARFRTTSPRGWIVPADRAIRVLNTMAKLWPTVATPAAQAFIDARQDAAARIAASIERDTQTALAALGQIEQRLLEHGITPFAHQRVAFDRMIRQRRLVLADDMGLGKTLSAIVSAHAISAVTRAGTLILSPASVTSDWLDIIELVGATARIYSWAKLPEPPETPYILIADEAHYAASGTMSLRGKGFLKLADAETCIACFPLTGTPMPNGNPLSMWSLLHAVRAPHAESEYEFFTLYGRGYVSEQASRRLHKANLPYVLRREKEECLDLPPRIHTLRRITLGMEAIRIYNDALAEMRLRYHERVALGEISSEGEAIVLMNHVRAANSIGKVEASTALARDILAQGDSVVIFVEFLKAAHALAEALKEFGVELLIGKVPTKLRAGMKERFQAGQSRVFVSTGAGGVGITLTRAHDVILHDRPWRPEDTRQRIDRLHRIGQTSAVNVQWVQSDAIDRYIDALHAAKLERIGLVLHGDAGASASINDLLKALVQV